ncbi:BnaA06g09080D [Brassica napus]|uniref:BnaA06g09080D protein n=1 Tax=Brassica napus TaxID=3708 RepID=A0A078IJ44_BRANA|nr:BnaA06g09080D [Brassica napus]
MDLSGNSPASGDHQTSKKTVGSSATAKSTGKSTASSATVVKPNGKAAVSSANPMEPNAATALSSMPGDQVMFFREVSLGPREAELMFRMIHFWEARNPNTKTLIGQEMLLIDREVSSRVGRYELTAGSVYKLINFFGSRSKDQYRVADHSATVSFSWNSSLSVLENPPVQIPEDRFRFHTYEEFKSNCDSKGDLYDYVGHMKLTHDGPVMKLYLWDKAAADFCQKFKSYGNTPSVLLVTTVNPKHLGGTLALTSMSSSRVFMDADVQPTKDYLEWLNSNSDIANRIAAEVVTKPESVTLEELFSYIKQDSSKVAWFECMATIDDVVQGSAWYYISCGGCNSKAVKGHTSLICNNKKCVKTEVTGVPQYLTRISVYDKTEQAVFVILGDAGKELTGKHAAELVANYFEANDGVGADHCVPVPQALLDTIGQTRKFIVKVSDHNLTGKTQTITVTKILPPEAPLPSTVGVGSGSSGSSGDTAGDKARKAAEILEADEAKRPKSG